MSALPKPPLIRLIYRQLALSSIFCIIASLIWPSSWLSIVCGALVALVPQAVFSLLAFQHQSARQPRKLVQALFLAEGVKLGLTVVLFALVFLLVQPSNPISFISTYAAVVLFNWLNYWLLK